MDLTPEAAGTLLDFEDLLRDRAVPLGLVAEGDAGRIRERHVLDCLRAAGAVGPEDRSGYDLGSGAGLPGLVVAIARPMFHVKLVEVRPKRAAFLELAVERLGLPNASVVVGRVEDLAGPVDLCFARAYAPAEVSWRQAEPLLGPGGRLVYFAGEGAEVLVPGARIELLGSGLAGCGPLAIISRT
ncbi:MAG: 16S rRNA (guanine(527)-N(7))-methyltransferase RsmG [Actinomycetota bacterium]